VPGGFFHRTGRGGSRKSTTRAVVISIFVVVVVEPRVHSVVLCHNGGHVMVAMTDAPAISVKALRVQFGGEREVLHGVDLDIHRGETVVILGCSGSGKEYVTADYGGPGKANSGEVRIAGVDLATASERRWILCVAGLVLAFQGGALIGSLTWERTFSLPLLEHTGLNPSTIDGDGADQLEQVGLSGLSITCPHNSAEE